MVNDAQIEKIVGGLRIDSYDRVPESQGYGERAWRVFGKKMDLIVWDMGNSNYSIIRKIKHKWKKIAVVGIKGTILLRKTGEKTKIIGKNDRYVERAKYIDKKGQQYVQFDGKFWRYPQDVEY